MVTQKSFFSLIKNAYGGLSREVWLLSFGTLINRSGTLVILFLSLYITKELNYTVQNAGVVMAIFGAGSLCGVYLSGRLTDKIGYYPVMLFSLFGGGLLFIILGFLKSYLLICIFTFIMSCVAEAFRAPAMTAISIYSTPQTYTRSISLYRLAINLGFSVGPAAGGFLAMMNYQLIFWADGLTCICAGFIIFFFIKNKKKENKTDAEEKTEVVQSAYRDKPYLFFVFLCMLYAMCFFQFFSTMPLYYKNVIHLNEKQIGWIMALNGLLVAAIEMILIYKIESRWSKMKFIALGAFLLMISYVSLLFYSTLLWMIVLTVVISFSEMFALPFINAHMNSRSSSNNRGQYAALYAMSWSVAQILLPVVATQTIANFGYNWLWILMAGLCGVVMMGVLKIERTKNK